MGLSQQVKDRITAACEKYLSTKTFPVEAYRELCQMDFTAGAEQMYLAGESRLMVALSFLKQASTWLHERNREPEFLRELDQFVSAEEPAPIAGVSPKQKAAELVKKYLPFTSGTDPECLDEAKKLAQLSAQEILHAVVGAKVNGSNYWSSVKEEIENVWL